MKVLLVNQNTFLSPPTIPIGLEYAAHSLKQAGHDVRVFDMCFLPSPLDELSKLLKKESFDLAAVSFRNIDTSQLASYVNFVPELKELVDSLHEAKLKVVLGGSGFSGMPMPIMEHTGADFGIIGPADIALPKLCAEIDSSPPIINAWPLGIDPEAVPPRGESIDYKKYFDGGGIAGFATQFGCPEKCDHCIEAATPVYHRDPAAVVAEIRSVVEKGFDHFHLCDSEFNLSLARSLEFLRKLDAAKLDIRWALYMKPAPYSTELAKLLKRTGAYLITLTVESAEAASPGGKYDYRLLSKIIRDCKKQGIKLAIDLTIGAPGESAGSVHKAIEFFRRERPESVNTNAWFRVYGGTRLERLLRIDPSLQEHLTAPLRVHQLLLEPVFYSHIDLSEVKKLIGHDSFFKLEGFDQGTNYEQIRNK